MFIQASSAAVYSRIDVVSRYVTLSLIYQRNSYIQASRPSHSERKSASKNEDARVFD